MILTSKNTSYKKLKNLHSHLRHTQSKWINQSKLQSQPKLKVYRNRFYSSLRRATNYNVYGCWELWLTVFTTAIISGEFQWIEHILVNWVLFISQGLRNAHPSLKWYGMEYTLKPFFIFSLGRKANTGKVCATTGVVFNKGKVRKNVGGC